MSHLIPHRVSDDLRRIDHWVRLLFDGYFRPWAIERWCNGHIYELLGVRAYKRWLPTLGDRVCQRTGIHAIRSFPRGSSDCRQQLETQQRWTRRIEAGHVLAAFVMTCYSVAALWSGDFLNVSLLIAVNLAVNIYPIMTQRYNRVRIAAILRRMDSSGET
jgi:hypothetical protein